MILVTTKCSCLRTRCHIGSPQLDFVHFLQKKASQMVKEIGHSAQPFPPCRIPLPACACVLPFIMLKDNTWTYMIFYSGCN
jgi:hypothetical protein